MYSFSIPIPTSIPIFFSDPDFNCPVFFEAWGSKCYYFQGAHQSLSLAEHTCNNLAATPVSEPEQYFHVSIKFMTGVGGY